MPWMFHAIVFFLLFLESVPETVMSAPTVTSPWTVCEAVVQYQVPRSVGVASV